MGRTTCFVEGPQPLLRAGSWVSSLKITVSGLSNVLHYCLILQYIHNTQMWSRAAWQDQEGRGMDNLGFIKLKLFLYTPLTGTRQQRYEGRGLDNPCFIKFKLFLYTPLTGTRQQKYSYTLSQPRYPLNKVLLGPQSRFGRCEQTICSPCRESKHESSDAQPVA